MSTVGEGRVGEAIGAACGTAAVVGIGSYVAIPLAGAVVAVAGFVIQAAVVGGAGFVALAAANEGRKLAVKAAQFLASEVKQQNQKAHQDQLKIMENELKVQTFIFDRYRESLVNNKEAQLHYLESVLSQLDLPAIGVTRESVNAKLKSLDVKESHHFLDQLSQFIQIAKQLHQIQSTVQPEIFENKDEFEKMIEDNSQFISGIKELKFDQFPSAINELNEKRTHLLKFIEDQKFYQESKELRTLVADYQFDFNSFKVNPLIEWIKPQLDAYQSQLVEEDFEALYQQELIKLEKLIREYQIILNNLPQEDLVAFHKELETIKDFQEDAAFSLQTKIEYVRLRRKGLVERYERLEEKHRELLLQKKEFESLVFSNQFQRAKLGLPIDAYQFNQVNFPSIKEKLVRENEILNKKVEQIIQAKVAHEGLTKALEAMNFDYIEDSTVSKDHEASVESLLHFKDGLVLKVSARGKKLGFKMMRVDKKGKTFKDKDDLDNLKHFCHDILPDLEKKLKEQGIIDTSLTVIPPSIEEMGLLKLEQIPHNKDRLIIEEAVKIEKAVKVKRKTKNEKLRQREK